ncbi:MAG: hypothetical protein IPN05_19870 [Sulfuritalea sp.]|nr:hypothetical protein [Sulfuritalea sp.]
MTITGGSVITIASGSTSGTVSVAAPDEDVYLDSSTVSRSITGATGGNSRAWRPRRWRRAPASPTPSAPPR